jgi:hypothetical protein
VVRVLAICVSALSNPSDAVLLGAVGGDDEVRLGVANAWVVAATRIRSQWHADVRLEATAYAASELAFRWPGGEFATCFGNEKRGRGGRGIYRRGAW